MKKFPVSLLMFSVMLFYGCSDSEDGDQVVVDVSVHLTIEDAQGTDLLDPEEENAITQDDIHLFYEIDGSKVSFESANEGSQLDYPKGFFIGPSEGANVFGGKHVLTVFSNPTAGDDVITIIEVEGHDDITLSTSVSRKHGNTVVQAIRYDGDVVWKNDDDIPKYVSIVY